MSKVNELITRVLELDEVATPGPWISDMSGAYRAETARTVLYDEEALGNDVDLVAEYRTFAPLLARMLERALEALGNAEIDALQGIPWCSEDYLNVFEEIEVMA